MTTGRINQIDNMCESVAFGKREAPVPAPKRGKSAGSRQWGTAAAALAAARNMLCNATMRWLPPPQQHPPESSDTI